MKRSTIICLCTLLQSSILFNSAYCDIQVPKKYSDKEIQDLIKDKEDFANLEKMGRGNSIKPSPFASVSADAEQPSPFYGASSSANQPGIKEKAEKIKKLNLKKWMSELYEDYLADKPLKYIVIPGTHDSGTGTISDDNAVNSSDGKIPDIIAKILEKKSSTKKVSLKEMIPWTKTQDLSIMEQLEIGVRFFDLRVTVEEGDELYLSHGLRGEKLSDAFDAIRDFCNNTDKDLVIIKIKGFPDKKCKNSNPNELVANFFRKYSDLILQKSDIKIPRNLPSMTMKNILETGKRIIVLFDVRAKKGQTGELMKATLDNSDWLFDGDILESPWADTDSTPKLFEYTEKTAPKVSDDKLYALHWTLTANAGYIVEHYILNKNKGIRYMTSKINGGKQYDKDYSLDEVLKKVPRINIVEHDFIDRDKTSYLIGKNL